MFNCYLLFMKMTQKISYGLLLALFLFFSCQDNRQARDHVNQLPSIFPDYTGVTIPCNLAPINFQMKGATYMQAEFSINNRIVLQAKGKTFVDISPDKWKQLLANNKGRDITVTVSAWTPQHPEGAQYKPFKIHIDAPIDNYIAYRLIPPGYEEWNRMGLFQRDLTSFDESAIFMNTQNHSGCVNCHCFAWYNPKIMMFHARGQAGGTVVMQGDNIEKVNLDSLGPKKNGTYPMWHPSGKYIAFSSNVTKQSFYSHCRDKIEVYDLKSDIIIYDVIKHRVLADERFNDSINWETFPAFSPDGKWLYFCTAKAKLMPIKFNDLHYSLIRVPFNEKDGTLGSQIDTIYSAHKQGGSVSLPRISPDGRFLLFTWAGCSTFHIQHKDADLMLIDLKTNQIIRPANINSNDADSYHSWSKNGKWIIFASRRLDGMYSRLFIAPFKNGKFGKPFLLPQKDPQQNEKRLYSYNIPEFISGKVILPKDKASALFKIN